MHPGITDLVGLPQWVPRAATWRGRLAVRGFEPVISRLIAARKRDTRSARRSAHAAHEGARCGNRTGCVGYGMPSTDCDDLCPQVTRATAMAVAWALSRLGMHSWADEAILFVLNAVMEGEVVVRSPVGLASPIRTRFSKRDDEGVPAGSYDHGGAARADDVVVGHKVLAGRDVIVSPWLLHRHRKLWHDPERFRPRAKSLPGEKEQRSPFRISALRSGPADLHWPEFCDDGGYLDPCRAGAQMASRNCKSR